MFNFMRLPPLRRLMLMKAITGGGSWSTISGNPVTFSAIAAPLKQLSVAFSPVQSGSGDPSPDNVRPISGWDGVKVWRTGKNLNPNTGVNYTTNNATRVFLRAGTYTLSTNNGQTVRPNNQIYIRLFDAETGGNTITSGNIIGEHMQMNGSGTLSYGGNGYASVTVTIAVDCWFAVGFNNQLPENFSALQVEPGSTASAYEAYNGTSISISFGSTVYSGTLDVLTGVVTVTRIGVHPADFLSTATVISVANGYTEGRVIINTGMIDNTKASTMICDSFKCASFGDIVRFAGFNNQLYFKIAGEMTPEEWKTEIQTINPFVVYPLRDAQTIQLTPQEVESLAGDNTMWSNANQPITVEYRKN